MYRVGFPGWKVAARLGVPMKLRIDVMLDEEAHCYWTSSPDLKGLIVTGATLDEIRTEARLAATQLLELELHGQALSATPELRFKDAAVCAA